MSLTFFKAHYDGSQIVMDEPVDLPASQPLLVAVLNQDGGDAGDADWRALGGAHFLGAYGDDEPEYGPEDVVRE